MIRFLTWIKEQSELSKLKEKYHIIFTFRFYDLSYNIADSNGRQARRRS